jgi:hypothetical protein
VLLLPCRFSIKRCWWVRACTSSRQSSSIGRAVAPRRQTVTGGRQTGTGGRAAGGDREGYIRPERSRETAPCSLPLQTEGEGDSRSSVGCCAWSAGVL